LKPISSKGADTFIVSNDYQKEAIIMPPKELCGNSSYNYLIIQNNLRNRHADNNNQDDIGGRNFFTTLELDSWFTREIKPGVNIFSMYVFSYRRYKNFILNVAVGSILQKIKPENFYLF